MSTLTCYCNEPVLFSLPYSYVYCTLLSSEYYLDCNNLMVFITQLCWLPKQYRGLLPSLNMREARVLALFGLAIFSTSKRIMFCPLWPSRSIISLEEIFNTKRSF